jgi:hypothetical protein
MNVRHLPQNASPLAKAAFRWLMLERQHVPAHNLYLLELAQWGLESGADGEWPRDHQNALENQVALLFGWKPENALAWMLSNPEGPEKAEQEQSLLQALRTSETAKEAAATVLNVIYSRQVSDNPALQPAASG